MADPEHIRILEQGVGVWNRWRQENPDIRPNPQESGSSGKRPPNHEFQRYEPATYGPEQCEFDSGHVSPG